VLQSEWNEFGERQVLVDRMVSFCHGTLMYSFYCSDRK
jgi:hypothetical protein